MCRFNTFIFFYLIQSYAFSIQISNVDSLHSELNKSTNDKERVNVLSKLAMALRYRNTDSASYYAQEAYNLSLIDNYEWGLMMSSYNLGIVSRIKGDYDKALENYYKSLAIAEKTNEESYRSAILNALGVVHKIYEENALALTYFNQALKLINSEEAKGSIQNNIGEVYLAMDQYDSALKYCIGSLEVRKQIGDLEGQVKSLNNLGRIYIEINSYDSATLVFEKALKITESNNDGLGQIESQIGMSMLYYELKNYDKCIIYALDAIPIIEKLNTKLERLKVYKILENAYSAKLNYKSAYEYQKRATALGDSIFNEEKEKEINLLKLNKEEAENELLKKKNEFQLLTIQKQKALNTFIIIILCIVFILGIVLLYLLIMKRKTNAALANKALELQSANAIKSKMLSIVSHDIRSPLNNLHSLINLVKSGQISDSEFQKWIGDLSGQVSITRDFLDGLLNWAKYQINHDLVEAEVVDLKPLVKGVIEILQPQFEEKGVLIKDFLSGEICVKGDKEVIVLVLKNLLSNAIKFSHKNGEVEVQSDVKGRFVEVKVRDHGVGIEPDKLAKLFDFESHYTTKGTSGEVGTGLGLAFCKEFIELNGGEIWVESKENEGTIFYLSIPLAD